jgi:cytochrome b561
MERYAKPVVALHWLLAALILGAWVAGQRVEGMANTDAAKITALGWHMATGGTVLVLMALRLVLRLRTGAPPPVNRLAPVVHWLIYAAVFVMAGSGIAMSVANGLPGIVFGGTGTLPATFDGPARAIHGVTATLVAALFALHLAGVLWHGIQGKGVLGRMTFGA